MPIPTDPTAPTDSQPAKPRLTSRAAGKAERRSAETRAIRARRSKLREVLAFVISPILLKASRPLIGFRRCPECRYIAAQLGSSTKKISSVAVPLHPDRFPDAAFLNPTTINAHSGSRLMIRKQAPWIGAAPRPASASPAGAPRAAFACAPTCGLVVRPRPFRAPVFRTASRNARADFISRKMPSRCIFFFKAFRAWSTLLSRTRTCKPMSCR